MSKDEILDLPRRRSRLKWIAPTFYFAMACFGYWFVADLQHWPFAVYALLLGLACFVAVSTGRFLSNRKAGYYQIFYLTGRISLLVGVALYLNAWPYATGFFWTAFACFAVGILLLSRKKK